MLLLERAMNTIHKTAMVTGFAFSAFACLTMAGSSVRAGPIVPPGHYCMTWDIGGSDCSFTSYAQCQATASGIDAECYGKTLRDDEESRIQSRRGYNSRAQTRLTLSRSWSRKQTLAGLRTTSAEWTPCTIASRHCRPEILYPHAR
jgi:hypothetical protein